MYMYIHVCVCMYIYIYIYTHTHRRGHHALWRHPSGGPGGDSTSDNTKTLVKYNSEIKHVTYNSSTL